MYINLPWCYRSLSAEGSRNFLFCNRCWALSSWALHTCSSRPSPAQITLNNSLRGCATSPWGFLGGYWSCPTERSFSDLKIFTLINNNNHLNICKSLQTRMYLMHHKKSNINYLESNRWSSAGFFIIILSCCNLRGSHLSNNCIITFIS